MTKLEQPNHESLARRTDADISFLERGMLKNTSNKGRALKSGTSTMPYGDSIVVQHGGEGLHDTTVDHWAATDVYTTRHTRVSITWPEMIYGDEIPTIVMTEAFYDENSSLLRCGSYDSHALEGTNQLRLSSVRGALRHAARMQVRHGVQSEASM